MAPKNKNFIDLDKLYSKAVKESTGNKKTAANFELPKLNIPEFKLPDIKIPKFNFPKFKPLKIKIPKFKAPKFKIPKFKFVYSNILSGIIILIFVSMLIGPNVAWKAIGKWGTEEYNRENRAFSVFPEISKANYLNVAKGIEDWISDHTPFRQFFLELYASLNRYVFECADSRKVMFGKDGFTFFKINEDTIEDMLGIHSYTDDGMAKILAKMLKVRELYARHKDDYVLFIAPNKEVVYNDKVIPALRKKEENSTAKRLVKYIREHSDIKVVYPLGDLQLGRKNMDTYFATDDHWNSYGAYIGAGELIEAITGEKTDYSYFETAPEIDEPTLTDQLDMISMPKDYDKTQNFYVKGYSQYDTKSEWIYRTYPNFVIGIDCSLMEDPKDDRSVTIIRDSFAIKMMFVLSQYFKTVNYIHYSSLDADVQTGSSIFHSDIFVHEFVERSLWRIERDLNKLIENGERYFGEDENPDSYTKIIKGESNSKALEKAIEDVKAKKFVTTSTVRKVKGDKIVDEGPYAVDEEPYDPELIEKVYVPVDVKKDVSKVQKDIEEKINGIGIEIDEYAASVTLDSSIEDAIDEIAHKNKAVADIMRNIAIKTKRELDNK